MTQDWPLQIPRLPLLADLDGISLSGDESEWISKVPPELMEIISEVAILDGGCWLVGGQ